MFAERANSNYKNLQKKYDAYVDLYKFLNNGSTVGVTTFADFYWRFTYNVKYEDPSTVGIGNI